MSRALPLTLLVATFYTFSAHAEEQQVCGNIEAYIKNVSMDMDLSDEKRELLIRKLQRSKASCDEGNEDHAREHMNLNQANDEFARDYFTQLATDSH